MISESKLDAIKMGDIITYEREGTLVAQQVHGWKLCNNGHEHRVLVGSAYHDHEVSLSTIVARRRETLHGQDIIEF